MKVTIVTGQTQAIQPSDLHSSVPQSVAVSTTLPSISSLSSCSRSVRARAEHVLATRLRHGVNLTNGIARPTSRKSSAEPSTSKAHQTTQLFGRARAPHRVVRHEVTAFFGGQL